MYVMMMKCRGVKFRQNGSKVKSKLTHQSNIFKSCLSIKIFYFINQLFILFLVSKNDPFLIQQSIIFLKVVYQSIIFILSINYL